MENKQEIKFTFSQHALQQMFKRDISIENVKKCVMEGESIKSYDDDKPHPSQLSLLKINNVPLHVVFAINHSFNEYIIITAYTPDAELWNQDFKTKK